MAAETPFVLLPQPLRERLGEDGSQALVELLNHLGAQKKEIRELRAELRERDASLRAEVRDAVGGLRAEVHEEIGRLRAEMHGEISHLRVEMHEEIGRLRAEMYQAIGDLRAEVRDRLAKTHVSLIKWMFAFWIGQLGVILGILKLVGSI